MYSVFGTKQNYRLWNIIRVLVTLATFRPFKIVLRLDHVLKSSDFSRQIVDVKAIFLLSYGTLTIFFSNNNYRRVLRALAIVLPLGGWAGPAPMLNMLLCCCC